MKHSNFYIFQFLWTLWHWIFMFHVCHKYSPTSQDPQNHLLVIRAAEQAGDATKSAIMDYLQDSILKIARNANLEKWDIRLPWSRPLHVHHLLHFPSFTL